MRLSMPTNSWHLIRRHLLPEPSHNEEAAFLFGRHIDTTESIELIDYQLLSSEHFVTQDIDYLELRDEVRANLIKKAHDLSACLIEMHSHPGNLPAAFSLLDVVGLREIVPQMLWRLRNRPYVALVVADLSFDAFVWHHDASKPQHLDAIDLENLALAPTNLSFWRWQ